MWIKLTPEQRARADELLRSNPPPFKVKPKPKLEFRVKEEDLSPRVVQAIRKQPESFELRVTARDGEVVVVDRPRQTELIEVVETREGKASVARRYDCATGAWSMVGFEDGYRRSGVEHAYDPIARGLGGKDD